MSLAIVSFVFSFPQAATAGEWKHFVFEDRDTFGFENQQTGQTVFYGTREYGQIAAKWLPPSYRGSRGTISYQNGLYYFSVPEQPGSDLFWHAGVSRWLSAYGR
ncbi:MAG: hypothetical protein QMD77_02655 [Patescibacteria group bacterium]|nr:hypothetical protein [Patescibacteria group bacterium]